MQISNFITSPVSYTQSAYRGCVSFHQRILLETLDDWSQTDLWKQYGKPFYERRIEPLNNQTDVCILGGSLSLALVASALALKIFGDIALPLAVGGSAILLMGAFSFSQHRVTTGYFNEKAWEHIDKMRKIIENIDSKKQNFDQIHPHRAKLERPEFEHLKKHLKKLDKEISKFQKQVLKPCYEDQLEIVEAKLELFKDQCTGNLDDQKIIQALQKKALNIGTEDENLKSIETAKKELSNLQTLDSSQISEIKEEIQTLFTLSRKTHFKKSQDSLLTYMKELQKELAPHLSKEENLENLSEEETVKVTDLFPSSEEENSLE